MNKIHNSMFYFYTFFPILIVTLLVWQGQYLALVVAPIHLGLLVWLNNRIYDNDIEEIKSQSFGDVIRQ